MMSEPGGPAAPPSVGMSKSQRIGIGLLFTIVGLFLLSVLLPTAPEKLGYALPVAAAGILVLWIGGIFMGIGSRS